MNFEQFFLFFFSALGAFNAVILSIYFGFIMRPKHISNYLFSGLLLALTIRIWKSVFFYFNSDLAKIYLQIGLTACFFIGPMLFLYLRSLRENEHKTTQHEWKYHISPYLLISIYLGIVYPYQDYPKLWGVYAIRFIYLQWFIYIILSGFQLSYLLKIPFTQNQTGIHTKIWLSSVYVGNFMIWLAYNTTAYTSYITGALSFSFVFYLLCLLLFFQRKKSPNTDNLTPKYADKKIDNQEAEALIKQLKSLMQTELLYKNANLKLADVAKKLHITPHHLSQLMNDNLGKKFTDYINEYRIEEAKNIIQKNENLTLELIGYDCGFNSKSTFYTTFKKITGTTPAKYKKSII